MVKPVFFDIIENPAESSYSLYVLGDDGYLYIAIVKNPSIEVIDEKFYFTKVDTNKIDLALNNIKYGYMKVISRPATSPKVPKREEVYIAMPNLNTKVGKATLYKFYKKDGIDPWILDSVKIPNTTLCMEYGDSAILLGGIDGIVSINLDDITKQFIIDKIGMVLSLSRLSMLTFAGTERGLLVSLDYFSSLDFISYYPENTNLNMLAGGVGKVVPIMDETILDGIMVYLLGDLGISKALFKFEEQANTKITTTWGTPVKKQNIFKYSYKAAINSKDLVDGMYAGNEQLVKLFIMDIFIESSPTKGNGVLIKYHTPFDINADSINKEFVIQDLYYNSLPYDIKINPKLQLLPTNLRIFALSDQMELSLMGLNVSTTPKWIRIELPN